MKISPIRTVAVVGIAVLAGAVAVHYVSQQANRVAQAVARAAVIDPCPVVEPAQPQPDLGLPPAILAGYRAISIRVNDVVGVAGFVVPGTHVDVLSTIGQGREAMAKLVLADVLVLAAGTRLDQEAHRQDGKPLPTTVVTLMVTPAHAERLALATHSPLTLALRNPDDHKTPSTPGTRLTGLMGVPGRASAKALAAASVDVAAPVQQPAPIESYRAGKLTESRARP